MRRNLKEIKESGRIDPESKVLSVDGKEIGFVYYRVGYTMEHYMDE